VPDTPEPFKRPPRLILRLAVFGALTFAVAWVAIFWVVRSEEDGRARRQIAAHTAEVARRVAPILRRSDFTRPVKSARREELDAAFEKEIGDNVLRVKLWSREGVVTYSNDRSVIGQRSDDPAGVASVAGGHARQEVTSLNQEGGSGEDIKAIESYAPVVKGSSPAGVLEVYEAYAPVAADVREAVTPIGIALTLALVLLYAALFRSSAR
jgi:two-component system, NarL family, sensor kinase